MRNDRDFIGLNLDDSVFANFNKDIKNIIYLYMSKNINFKHIFIFILVVIVLIYLGKLLYGNLNNKLDYKTTYFDEDIDESDTESDTELDESDENKLTGITNSINPIPNTILTGPINDKADLSREQIETPLEEDNYLE